ERRIFPSAALEGMGGVTGALAHHADNVVASLTLEQRDAAQKMFLALLTSEPTRVRSTAAELRADSEGARIALDALDHERLVVVRKGDGEPVYEIAHESLAQSWAQLRQWLGAASDEKRILERIEHAAIEWERLGRRADGLLRGRHLAEAALLPG